MKRNLLFYSFLITAGLLMSNCKKDELVTVNGTISGKILDVSTKTGLADVAVTVKGTNAKGTTKSDGTFEVSGIPSGQYWVVFTKSGYMVGKSSVFIVISGAASKKSSSVDYRVIVNDVLLYPLTGKAKGVVFNEDGTLSSSATVKYIFNNDSTFTTTTDANGEFSFSALPFRPDSYVDIIAAKGDAYGSSYDYYWYTATKTLAYSIQLTQGSFKFLYGNYRNNGNINFPITSNIELTFSEDIDLATTLKKGSIYLYNNSYFWDAVGVDITVSGNKLIINPKRDLVKGGYYRVEGSVYANENKYAYIDGDVERFHTTPITPVIPFDITTKPTISMDGAKTVLTITPPTGAVYVMLYKASGANAEFINSDGSSVFASTVTFPINSDVTGTSYYVIAGGYDVNINPAYGAQSDIVTK